MFVKFPIREAEPVEKTDAIRMQVITVKTATSFWVVFPKYFETISGIVNPSFRSYRNPEKKSWTAPMNIVPNVIHRNAVGPNNAPCMTPNMGPKPAMFKK